eukprot:TRINITY_DN7649_c0_g1_i1.p1 TRINITY_DN7649_c0_g1~~TRINITY_DN7649_c0_g1_i1.p1  ORF type:complete len:408 (+),score=112.19 TRINITY_DN7649_c0_g1_i1:87-1226(+)
MSAPRLLLLLALCGGAGGAALSTRSALRRRSAPVHFAPHSPVRSGSGAASAGRRSTQASFPRDVRRVGPAVRSRLRSAAQQHVGVYSDSRRARFPNTVLVTVATWGFRDFFFNWRCFARKVGLRFLTLALDRRIATHLGSGAVLLADGKSGELAYNDLGYNELCCYKLEVVLELLSAGFSVLQTDADNVIQRDPAPILFDAVNSGYDWVYQANMPGCKQRKERFEPLCRWICGGFYYASGRKRAVRKMFGTALDYCWSITHTENGNDQRALQYVFDGIRRGEMHGPELPARHRYCSGLQRSRQQVSDPSTLEWCFMDPRLAPIGAPGHWRNHTNAETMVSFHANWVQGGTRKRELLANRKLWRYPEERSCPYTASHAAR